MTKVPLPFHARLEVPTSRDGLASLYASFIILLFSGAVVFIGFMANYEGSAESPFWRPIFKDSFVFLSGAVTTLIGFFFGNRGAEQTNNALVAVKEEREEAGRVKDAAETISRKAEEQLQRGLQDESLAHQDPTIKSAT